MHGSTGRAADDVAASTEDMDGGGSGLVYARPSPALDGLVTGYQVFFDDGAGSDGRVNYLLPGVANVRVAIGAGPVEILFGRGRRAVMPPVAAIGLTTYAPCVTTHGGALVGFGVTPLGWGRLFGRHAAELCDRVAPLEELVGPDLPAALLRELTALPTLDARSVAPVLDRLLAPAFARPGPDELGVRALSAALDAGDAVTVADLATATGLDAPALRRLAARYVGATPKLLLNRARFLRAFLGFFRAGDDPGYPGIDAHYYDTSHFLRDADRFLGMTPRRFAALSTESLDRSLRARAAVLGGSTCVLHPGEAA